MARSKRPGMLPTDDLLGPEGAAAAARMDRVVAFFTQYAGRETWLLLSLLSIFLLLGFLSVLGVLPGLVFELEASYGGSYDQGFREHWSASSSAVGDMTAPYP